MRLLAVDKRWVLFALAAAWALLVTWFVQLYLLSGPLVNWSAGEGMLAGHDITNFHAVAQAKAAEIAENGWSAWELRPHDWGVSGLLSAWYAITAPKLWLWAPLQALLFGFAAVLMRELILKVFDSPRIAGSAVIIVLLLPGAALLYVYPHRDFFVFLGFLLVLYGSLQLMQLSTMGYYETFARLAISISIILLGFFCAIAVRQVAAQIFMGLSFILVLVAVGAMFAKPGRSSGLSVISLVFAMLLMGLVTFSGTGPREFHAEPGWTDPKDAVAEVEATPSQRWAATPGVPLVIDQQFENLAAARDRVIRIDGHGLSAIDLDITFRSIADFIVYLPRAAQIGLLAPFPKDWLPHPDTRPHRNVERVLMGAEMMVVYALLPFLLLACWRYRQRLALWVIALPAISWIMLYALTVPVVGTLVRYRYGPLLLLLAVALAMLLKLVNLKGVSR